jgi:O-antigen/teichoic acid export membrane protein
MGITPGDSAVPSPRFVANSIARAFSVYGLANFGIRALNFLLLPIFTRFLTPVDYGVIVLAETLAVFMTQVIGLGFDAALQRLYFRYVDDSIELSDYVGSVLKSALVLQIAFLALVFTIGPWIQRTLMPTTSVPFRYIAMAIATTAASQLFNYRLVLYQAERRPWAYAVLSVLSFALTASLTIALVVFAHRGVGGMLGGKLIASGLCLLIAAFLSQPVMRSCFHWAYVRVTLQIGVPLVPHLAMALCLITADRFILAHYRSLHEVGLYGIAYTFGMIMSLVTMSLNQAWAPVYYDLARKGEEGCQVLGKMCIGLILVLTAVACFGSLLAQDFIAHFLDPRYVSAGRVVPWVIGAYLAHSLFSMFSLAAMHAGHTKVIMGASFVAFVVNMILNFALIPHWGMYGAAYATLAAYVVEALVMYWLAQRSLRLDYHPARIFAAMGVFAGVLGLTQIHWSPSHRPVAMLIAAIGSLGLLFALGRNRDALFRLDKATL